MMSLFESPWTILLVGIAVEAILAIMLLRTGQGKLLLAMIGVAGLLGVGLLVERLVVTEREQVEQTLDRAVAAVQANDLNAMLACIAPTATKTQADARYIYSNVEFREARIGQLEITINRLTNPPTAKAKFVASGAAQYRKATEFSGQFVRRVTVNCRKEDGRWLLADYTVEDFPIPK